MVSIVKKVYMNKSNNQLIVCIPIKSGIKAGDYVTIDKLELGDQDYDEKNTGVKD